LFGTALCVDEQRVRQVVFACSVNYAKDNFGREDSTEGSSLWSLLSLTCPSLRGERSSSLAGEDGCYCFTQLSRVVPWLVAPGTDRRGA
jgi:hypothetical protein